MNMIELTSADMHYAGDKVLVNPARICTIRSWGRNGCYLRGDGDSVYVAESYLEVKALLKSIGITIP